MRKAANIYWLGIKELRSFLHDYVLAGPRRSMHSPWS